MILHVHAQDVRSEKNNYNGITDRYILVSQALSIIRVFRQDFWKAVVKLDENDTVTHPLERFAHSCMIS